MRLYLDLDDTLRDLVGPWLTAINAVTGERLTPADITDWELGQFTRLGERAYQFIHEPWLYRQTRLFPGAARVTARLTDTVPIVRILTAEVPEAHAVNCEWVDRHLPWIGHRHMIACHDKSLLARPGDVLVDDKPTNIRDWRAAGGIGVVYDRPWNQQVARPRVYSWDGLWLWLRRYMQTGVAA